MDGKDGVLPVELDFFKYAKGSSSKRKVTSAEGREESDAEESDREAKKRRIGEDEEESRAADDPPMPKHRVTSKGRNVPEHADSFEALRERYKISSQLLSNLQKNGYARPTGIQAHGCPIMLEVCLHSDS